MNLRSVVKSEVACIMDLPKDKQSEKKESKHPFFHFLNAPLVLDLLCSTLAPTRRLWVAALSPRSGLEEF